MDEKTQRMVPEIMKFLSGILKRALPTTGRRINEETLKIPIRKPISASLAPNLER
jgi:hypothetical protein